MICRRFQILIVCIAFFSTSAACCSETYDSPAEVYAAAQKELQKADYRGLANCLSGDSLEMWAWMMVIASQSAKQELQDKPRRTGASPKSIDAVLSAHGLSEEKIKAAVVQSLVTKKADRGKVFKELLQNVKHKPRFIAEVFSQLQKTGLDVEKLNLLPLLQWMKEDFQELKIAGEEATATVIEKAGKDEKRCTVRFKKSAEGWLIHFPMDF